MILFNNMHMVRCYEYLIYGGKMMDKYFKPYGLNIEYEINTYKNVGKDYGNRKDANLGLLLNMKRFIRKSVKNRGGKLYKFCHTYTEWKEHVKQIFPRKNYNYEDILHWLYKKKRNEESRLEAIKAILIPVYIAFLGTYEFGETFVKNKYNSQQIFICMIMIMIIIIIASVKVLGDAEERVDFYKDFISIVEDEKE